VNGNGGNVQLSAARPLIQRLNVFQPMFKPVTAQIDLVLRDRVEHERVVRIGGMTKGEAVITGRCHFVLFLGDFSATADKKITTEITEHTEGKESSFGLRDLCGNLW
jgi:hypothetical protein